MQTGGRAPVVGPQGWTEPSKASPRNGRLGSLPKGKATCGSCSEASSRASARAKAFNKKAREGQGG
eukprot:3358215-Pyramimonas_sp.AAC.1